MWLPERNDQFEVFLITIFYILLLHHKSTPTLTCVHHVRPGVNLVNEAPLFADATSFKVVTHGDTVVIGVSDHLVLDLLPAF